MKDAATRQEIIVEERIRVTETEEIFEAEIPMMKVNGNRMSLMALFELINLAKIIWMIFKIS